MKINADTGSLHNYLMSGTTGQPTPAVGMGITELCWTDRHAGTIVRVSPSGQTFWYQRDTATRDDHNGMSEAQNYTFTADPTAPIHAAKLNSHGAWTHGRTQIAIGYRHEYYDFSF